MTSFHRTSSPAQQLDPPGSRMGPARNAHKSSVGMPAVSVLRALAVLLVATSGVNPRGLQVQAWSAHPARDGAHGHGSSSSSSSSPSSSSQLHGLWSAAAASRRMLGVAGAAESPESSPAAETIEGASSNGSAVSAFNKGLSVNYYEYTCPEVREVVRQVALSFISKDFSLAPALTRMLFHDAFVQGSDASVLLNVTLFNIAKEEGSFGGSQNGGGQGEQQQQQQQQGEAGEKKDKGEEVEKKAPDNRTLRGFFVIDAIKAALEAVCPGVVSCADIVALTAGDAVQA
eukprot:jgi/Mesen1/1391/ME000013S00882